MSTQRVDQLNILLMLGSLAAAFVVPFELFLFSYAVLGPLHYLTEIAWLHQRGYFTRRVGDGWWLVGLCMLLLLVQYRWLPVDRPSAAIWLNAVALGAAGAFALVDGTARRWTVVGVAALVGAGLATTAAGDDWLRLMLPTLVHVWLFTGAFLLLGALRNRSATGLTSVGVFVACSLACFLVDPPTPLPGEQVDGALAGAYAAIVDINDALARWLGLGALAADVDVYFSRTGRVVARFVAFAYTYHYLNWFSKTSVIQWHRIPRAWALTNLVLWIAAVALYAHDYRLGLSALFGLSYLHVYLELPLNGRTFAGIGQHLTGRAGAG